MASTPDLEIPAECSPKEIPVFTPRVISGIEPNGPLHLGNYFGAVKQHIELQHEYPGESYFLVANYHALTNHQDQKNLREESWQLALDYLALGVDPVKATFYRQSDVPQTCELLWMLVCLMPIPDLVRARQFLRDVGIGTGASVGKLLYPALMAADILGVRATIVPVGKDQVEPIAIARKCARRLNARFECPFFPEPETRLNEAAVVPGPDGQGMHRINRNTLPLFASEEDMKRWIMMIQPSNVTLVDGTDHPEEPILQWLQLLEGPSSAADWRVVIAEPAGFQGALEAFHKALGRHLEPYRQQRRELERDMDTLEDILRDGARRAREQMAETVGTLRELVGMGAYRRSLRS